MNKEVIEKARLALEKTQYTDAQKQSIYDEAMKLPDIAVMCSTNLINKEIVLKALQIGLDNTNEMYADMIVCEHNPTKKKHLSQIWDNERQYIMLAIEQIESSRE